MRKGITLSIAALGLIGMIGSTSAFAATTPKTAPPPKYQHNPGHGFEFSGNLPAILKISKTTLQADLKAGESILQIAQKKNIPEKTLIADMEKDYKAQLNKLVTSKKITATKEKQMIARYDGNITKMITGRRKFK